MFADFNKNKVFYSNEHQMPFVKVFEDENDYFPLMILKDGQKINMKHFSDLMDQIEEDNDTIFCCDFENKKVYLTKKEFVKNTKKEYKIKYITFDID